MLTALIARSPVFGGKVKSFAAEKALAVSGVRQVVEIDRGLAVVADGFWPAKLGREALEIDWDEGPLAGLDSEQQRRQYAELADLPGAVARQQGNVAAALAQAAARLECRLRTAVSGPRPHGTPQLPRRRPPRWLRHLDRHPVPDRQSSGRGRDHRPET